MKIKSVFNYILTPQYPVTHLPEKLQQALTEWTCPPLRSLLTWNISGCVQHYFAKCFSHPCLSASDAKLSAERPLYSENNVSLRKGIKKGSLKKIAGHTRPPFGSASLELWMTILVLQLCGSPASGGCIGSRCTEAATEKRTNCDKSSSLCCTSWHFLGQMYHSPPKISSHVANCYHCEESQQLGKLLRVNLQRSQFSRLCTSRNIVHHFCRLTHRGWVKNGQCTDPPACYLKAAPLLFLLLNKVMLWHKQIHMCHLRPLTTKYMLWWVLYHLTEIPTV